MTPVLQTNPWFLVRACGAHLLREHAAQRCSNQMLMSAHTLIVYKI